MVEVFTIHPDSKKPRLETDAMDMDKTYTAREVRMRTILIADPDSASRNAIALILKHRLGAEHIREAGDMETLIHSLADCPPGLLLLDWNLYGAPASATCNLLRKAYPSLKIVLISSDERNCFEFCNADVGFIYKGAEPDQLLGTLSDMLKE
jgi:DNA-binding NarL/FixJ family response regulator